MVHIDSFSERGCWLRVRNIISKEAAAAKPPAAKPPAAKPPAAKPPATKPPAAKPAAGSSSASDEEDPSESWYRFRRQELTHEQRATLIEQVCIREQHVCDEVFGKNQFICFLDRVCREYVSAHKRLHRTDVMHLHRETVLRTAVSKILPQLRPKVVKPLEGNVSDIVEAIQPMVETILDLCGQKAAEKEGTSLWVAARIKKDDYSYADCCEHPDLMQAMVDKKIALYRSKGSPDGSHI